MICTHPCCGKSWSPGDEGFPLCITYGCPLRAFRDAQMETDEMEEVGATKHGASGKQSKSTGGSGGPMRRMRYHSKSHTTAQLTKESAGTKTSIVSIQNRIGTFQEYVMNGKMKATTTVKTPDGTKKFDTKDQMHSEIAAITYMLQEKHWHILLGTIVDGKGPISSDDFQTSEPHCGFCTILLKVLNLPLSKPTKGNFNMACNLKYPLPEQIRTNPWVLARMLDNLCYCGFNKLKVLLNAFVAIPQDQWVLSIRKLATVDENHYVEPTTQTTIPWEEIIQKEGVLDAIWSHIYECIYKLNK